MALLNDDDPKAVAKKQQKIPSVLGNFFSKYKEITKGQLILKCLFGIFNSPKKRTKNSTLLPQVELFSFIFWEN